MLRKALLADQGDPLSEIVVVGMPEGALEEAEGGSGGVLSVRELEILLLASRGLSNRQIASRLHLAEDWITVTDITGEAEEA